MASHVSATHHVPIGDVRRRLADQISRYAPPDGEGPTVLSNLFVTSRTTAGSCDANLEPSLVLFAQGKKTVGLGNRVYKCDHTSFLLTSVELPLWGQIVEATKEVPMLQLRLTLDLTMVREVLAEISPLPMGAVHQGLGIAQGESTLELLDACSRLIGLLHMPEEIPFLSELIQREILFRLLRSPQGARLRSTATAGDLGNRTAKAIPWLKAHYTEPIQIAKLASLAGMGVSTLHHQFRALTGMSPLQYQKQLRLYAARDRMSLEGVDASSAAFEVGYESVSQFTREYRRLFGQPPMRDVRDLRKRSRMI
jgi:AraC-like DNA-binding protein